MGERVASGVIGAWLVGGLALTAGLGLAACGTSVPIHAPVPTHELTIDRGIAYGRAPLQRLDVYKPYRLGEPSPVVLFVHGDDRPGGSRGDYLFVAEALVSRGFVVIIPDYRSPEGVGRSAAVNDIATALGWVGDRIHLHGGRPDGIVVVGHGAGANLAARAVLDRRRLLDAGIDPEFVRGFIALEGSRGSIGFETPDPAGLHAAVDTSGPAMMLVAARGDTGIPAGMQALAEAASEAGVPVETMTLPHGGPPGVITRLAPPYRNEADLLDAIAEFVRVHTHPDSVRRR